MKYPTRCKVVDIAGHELVPGIVASTPDVSKSHIEKEGIAEKLSDGNVKITLDDGTILMGYECWWIPISGTREDEK